MEFLDWLTKVWPLGVIFAGLALRLEVAQALNKQEIRHLGEQRDDDRDSVQVLLASMQVDMREIRAILTRKPGGTP